MKKLAVILVTGLFVLVAAQLPAQASQGGMAGIEFYHEPGGGSGGGSGSGGSGGGGGREQDTDPPRRPAAEIYLPDDDIIWMADPGKDLGQLPRTGSQQRLATGLVAAGAVLLLAARRVSDSTG